MGQEMMLELKSLGKHYPGFELRDVNLSLPRGYIMGLIGPNGAGKTTIIRIIMNLSRADTGRALVCGLDSNDESVEIKRRVGYVGENINLYDGMTVEWIAGFVRHYYPSWDDALFGETLARYGIDPRKKAGALSKGTRVKLAFALAIARRPELLVLDEPTAGLDPIVRREILGELSAFVGDDRCGVLLSTHLTADLDRIADYVAILDNGRLVECAEKDELLERYCDPGSAATIEDVLIDIVKGAGTC